MTPKRSIAVAITVVAALALAACSKTIDTADLEKQLADQYAAQGNAENVTAACPDDEDAKEGNQFTCTVTDDKSGDEIDVIVTMQNDDGAFTARVKK